jgi:hypothetical protein
VFFLLCPGLRLCSTFFFARPTLFRAHALVAGNYAKAEILHVLSRERIKDFISNLTRLLFRRGFDIEFGNRREV